MISVKKRNGSTEAYDIDKTRQVINFACEGLDVNPLQLESRIDQVLYDGISTADIHANLIEHSKQLCSPQSPDWVFVTGRLNTMRMWSESGAYKLPFKDFVKKQIADGIWVHEGFSKYTDEQLEEFGKVVDKNKDLAHSYASTVTFESKYLDKNECIQHLFAGNALVMASVENEDVRLEWAKTFYEGLSNRKISVGSPWNMNLRADGNISSCFIIAPMDDLEDIYYNVTKAAKTSKVGGGLGVFMGHLRGKGDSLMGVEGMSGGTLPFIKVFNDTAVAVNQAGKRKGAFTIALPIWHRDVLDFLELQTEVGDQRKKAHDIKPQLTVPDLFMRLKDDNEAKWYLFSPYEVESKLGYQISRVWGEEWEFVYNQCVQAYHNGVLKVVEVVGAKELWKKVMRVHFETGMPYISWIDEINRHNPNKHEGMIVCVNLCVESFSVVDDKYNHTCNIASVVVGRVPFDELAKYAAITTRILDNGIALTKAPTVESKAHNERYRTVGVGVQGLADILAREGKGWNDEEFISSVFEEIQLGCVQESVRLAEERGAFPAFKGSDWDNGVRIKNFAKHSKKPDVWMKLQERIDVVGIRNSQLTSPAPNTSTSIAMDAGAGVMPVYSAFFYEDNKDGSMPVSAMLLKENPLHYARDVTKFNPASLTKVVGWAQRFVDTGISAEYVMDKNNPSFSAKTLWDTLQSSWENKNKAVYYIRTIKEGEQLVQGAEACVGCAG